MKAEMCKLVPGKKFCPSNYLKKVYYIPVLLIYVVTLPQGGIEWP